MVSRLRPSDWAASRGESAKRSTAAIGLFGVVVILIATNLPPRHKLKTGVKIYYILPPSGICEFSKSGSCNLQPTKPSLLPDFARIWTEPEPKMQVIH